MVSALTSGKMRALNSEGRHFLRNSQPGFQRGAAGPVSTQAFCHMASNPFGCECAVLGCKEFLKAGVLGSFGFRVSFTVQNSPGLDDHGVFTIPNSAKCAGQEICVQRRRDCLIADGRLI